jgi:hypothetical protein
LQNEGEFLVKLPQLSLFAFIKKEKLLLKDFALNLLFTCQNLPFSYPQKSVYCLEQFFPCG